MGGGFPIKAFGNDKLVLTEVGNGQCITSLPNDYVNSITLCLVAELEYTIFSTHGADLFILGPSLLANASCHLRVNTRVELPFPIPLSPELRHPLVPLQGRFNPLGNISRMGGNP